KGFGDTIRGAPLAGGGAVDILYGPGQGWGPIYLAVLRAPLGTGPPSISREIFTPGSPGRRLSCSPGAWAADLVGAFLCRSPQSFAYQWTRDGTDIGGATAAAYMPTAPGSYPFRVTATNRAG